MTGAARPPLRVFLFGAPNGAAAEAKAKINRRDGGVLCVGYLNPGWGSVQEMSSDHIIEEINRANAQFLVASLAAHKGQSWLWRNHKRIHIPVRANLGATINFVAGRVQRAPRSFRRMGLEWLWRIKEEPELWRRYWNDGFSLVRLVVARVLPLIFLQASLRGKDQELHVNVIQKVDVVIVHLSGYAGRDTVGSVIGAFQKALTMENDVEIDLDHVCNLDARFLGVLLMLRKQLLSRGRILKIICPNPKIRRIFKLQRLGFLLTD